MATTSPIRIDDELYASAKLVGGLMSRSAAQQLAHWARIGREIESGEAVSHRAITEVLAQRREYDELDAHEQAIVRAEWSARITERRTALDLVGEFSQEGWAAVELDGAGEVVRRDPASLD